MQQQFTFLPLLVRRAATLTQAALTLAVLASLFCVATAFTPSAGSPESAQRGLGAFADTTFTKICAGEFYLFGDDTLTVSGFYTDTLMAEDGTDSIVSVDLDVLPVSLTNLEIRICDSSEYVFGLDTLTLSGLYHDTLSAANGCDSIVTLRLIAQSYFDDTLGVTICEGDTYLFGGDTLDVAGIYTDSLTAAGGCDSIVTVVLHLLPPVATTVQASICANETYVFGGDTLNLPGNYVDTLSTTIGCDSIVTLKLIVLPLADSTFSDVICANGAYDFNGQILTVAGVYTDTLTAENGCDSLVTFTLDVLPTADSTYALTLCAFETYDFNNQILDESGVYTATLTAENGCDSIVTLHLTVLPEQTLVLNESICTGESYAFAGLQLTLPGVYSTIVPGTNGCDSVILLNLAVLSPVDSAFTATICANETFIFGNDTLNLPGTYQDTLSAANGCDSTVTLTLLVLPTADSALTATICANENFAFNGQLLTQAGIYTDTLDAANGCDSLVTLTLNVLPLGISDQSATICAGDTVLFNGQVLTLSGTYRDTFTAVNGCDSIASFVLTVLPLQTSQLSGQICQGASYFFDNQLLTESGTYTAVYPDVNGCDSTATLTLEVLPALTSALEATICAGETYSFNGLDLDQSGTYMAAYVAGGGCDSIVTLTLTVLPAQNSTLDVAICPGETYLFDGQDLTDAGTYLASYTDVNGCDSTSTLNLSILPTTSGEIAVTICSNETYNFNGQILNQGGTYSETLTGANGCDSTSTLVLTVLPTTTGTASATICSNETYTFYGQTLNQSGNYTTVLTGANGCDSTLTLQLTVLPTAASTVTASICAGQSYAFHGTLYNQSGAYSFTFTAANGCDSVETLNLTVHPIPTTTLSFAICQGTTFTYNGDALTTTGSYPYVFTSVHGCDSLVTVNLTVTPSPATNLDYTICAGTNLVYQDDTLTQSGNYTYFFVGSTGCDSTVLIHLNILPTLTEQTSATICHGDTYLFNGQVLSQSGTYTGQGFDPTGCPSIVVLTLTILPEIITEINAAVCQGDTYLYNNQPLSPGAYEFIYTGAGGCDSTVVLTLEELPASATNLAATICEGESYAFGGLSLTQAGLYTVTLTNVNGCDSLVTLALTVNSVQIVVTQQGNTLVAQGANNATYQWIDCATNQPIAGETDASFTATVTGSYAVVVTENGCSAQSPCIPVTVVGTHEAGLDFAWAIQPNPARDFATVQLAAPAAQALEVTVFDLNGRLLQRQQLPQGATALPLDLSALPQGILLVKITDGQQFATRRLVKTND